MKPTSQDTVRPMPRTRVGALLVLSIALAAATTGPSAAAHRAQSLNVVRTPKVCVGAALRPSPANVPRIEAATLCLINELRQAKHLHSLRFNSELHAVAAGQTSEMVVGDYFGDNNRAGQTPLQRIVASRYPAHAARVSTAQNIGWGTGPDATPAAMLRAWLSSPPHRRIILTPGYRDIGIGVTPAVPTSVTGNAFGATYTVEFGVRRRRGSAAASGAAGHSAGTGAGLGGGTTG